MRRRALREAQTPDRLKRNRSLAGNSQLSMEEKKRKVIRNLRHLESLGVVDSANQYQEIINEMAKVALPAAYPGLENLGEGQGLGTGSAGTITG